MTGVPITDLCCPTCGMPYRLPLEVQREDYPTDFLAFGARKTFVVPRALFIECAAGHKWTLKTLFQRKGEPDALLLGDYIGGP